MKAIPIMRCKNMRESIYFYTRVLDFQIRHPGATPEDVVITIFNGNAELQLSVIDGLFGNPVNIRVNDIDRLFQKYVDRGLRPPLEKPNSPVHQGPLDQTWGMREFYVDDPSGNTLRFCMPICTV